MPDQAARDQTELAAERDSFAASSELDPESIPTSLPRNNWRSTILRLLVSIAFLFLLFWRLPSVSLKNIVPEFTLSTISWLVFAVLIHVLAYVLQTLRWAQVSTTLGQHLPFRKMFGFLLAGEFVSNALPTSFGGDVVRVMRQGRATGDYAGSFAATGLERLSGWLVLPLISGFALAVRPELLRLGGASLTAVLVNAITLIGLVGLLWLAGHERGAGRLVGRTGWRRFLASVHLGVVAFRGRPWQVLSVLGAGIGFQFLQCVSVFGAAKALGLSQVDLIAAMAFFPPTAVMQNMPLALGGLGVREAAFLLFFGSIGVADPDTVALGLLVYFVFIVASLAGAPSFALHRSQKSDAKVGPEKVSV